MSGPDHIAAVFALRQRYWANGYRPVEIWNPDQRVTDKGDPLNSPGKQPRGRWRKDAAQDPPVAVRTRPDPRALNTGIATTGVTGFDVDILDPALADRIVHLIETVLGPTPLVRIGRSPKILLVYRPERPFSKISTADFIMPDGTKAQIEVLADGQQFVAAGIHPHTGQPYTWTDGSPETVPIAELPIVTEGPVRDLILQIEHLLREAGGKTRHEHKQPRKLNGSGGDFFKQANEAALADIGPWVRALFPRARFEGTGAWRISSKDLGRHLEEDISVHPSGIRDFGEETAQTPIDLVMRHSSTGTAIEAALWLCDRLRIDAATLGWVATRATGAAAKGEANVATNAAVDLSYLSLAVWLIRDIPDPDFLLGELLSTTSRFELIGPTGLGKTNLLIAAALAVSDGSDFLHWRGSGTPRRVLYVDGEMSRRLSKRRLADAVRRHGCTPPTFFYLNREDFPDMPPLNTEAGQKFIDRVIDSLGGADLAIFDNVQALLSGDMKDEVPWQQTLPWVRDLTRRNVGQIWVHHTGHDESHGYSSKTREWQMDVVALMETIERPEAGCDVRAAPRPF